MKEIEGAKETLSLFEPDGTLTYQHSVEYEIKLVQGLTFFEFWNVQVLVGGEEEGQDEEDATEQAPSSQRNRYVLKIHNDQWYEV